MAKYTIYSYSILFSAAEAFKGMTPYLCAIVEQDNGDRFASLIGGYKEGVEISVGQEVHPAGQDAAGKALYSV